MKKIVLVLIWAYVISVPISVYSQRGPDPKKIIDQLGRTAEAFFLSANRPSYSVGCYVVEKGSFEISIDLSFNNNLAQAPISLSYGLLKRVELFTGIDAYNQTYKFDGSKVSGIGDANVGVAYEFQISKHFTHVFQTLVKIPTASANRQLGTGHADYHFGIAEGFSSGKFGYELSFDAGLLHKRDLPALKAPGRIYTQGLLDSIRNFFDYKFEPEITIDFAPSISLSDKFLLYTGISFSRDTRLDFNTSTAFMGFGYSPSDAISLSLGGANGFGSGGNWEVNTGVVFSFR